MGIRPARTILSVILLFFIFLFSTGMIDMRRSEPLTLVVLPVSTFGTESFVGENLSRLIACTFSRFAGFEVLTFEEVDEVLDAWEEGGLEECSGSLPCIRQKIADIGFEKVLGGNLKRDGEGYFLTLYLYDVDSGEEEARYAPGLLSPEDVNIENLQRVVRALFPRAEFRPRRYLYGFNLFNPAFLDGVVEGSLAPEEPYYVEGYEEWIQDQGVEPGEDHTRMEQEVAGEPSEIRIPPLPGIERSMLEGIPLFGEEVVPGFYLYIEGEVWYLRWLFGKGKRQFSGIVKAGYGFEKVSFKGLKEERGDIVKEDHGILEFFSEQGAQGEGRGIEFVPRGGKVYFELSINGRSVERGIYLGKGRLPLSHNPFVVE